MASVPQHATEPASDLAAEARLLRQFLSWSTALSLLLTLNLVAART